MNFRFKKSFSTRNIQLHWAHLALKNITFKNKAFSNYFYIDSKAKISCNVIRRCFLLQLDAILLSSNGHHNRSSILTKPSIFEMLSIRQMKQRWSQIVTFPRDEAFIGLCKLSTHIPTNSEGTVTIHESLILFYHTTFLFPPCNYLYLELWAKGSNQV